MTCGTLKLPPRTAVNANDVVVSVANCDECIKSFPVDHGAP